MISVALFVVGIFVIYIAAADETLFNMVLDITDTDRLGVTVATTVAAAVPMFFAVGMIRKAVSNKWFTIYQYEDMLNGKVFWVLAIIVLIIIALLHIGGIIFGLIGSLEIESAATIIESLDIDIKSGATVIGCLISSIYLARYISKRD